MSNGTPNDFTEHKSASQRIAGITQKIVLTEEKLEKALKKDIDSTISEAHKMDKAVKSFSRRHAVLYKLIIVLVSLALFALVIFLSCLYYGT